MESNWTYRDLYRGTGYNEDLPAYESEHIKVNLGRTYEGRENNPVPKYRITEAMGYRRSRDMWVAYEWDGNTGMFKPCLPVAICGLRNIQRMMDQRA